MAGEGIEVRRVVAKEESEGDGWKWVGVGVICGASKDHAGNVDGYIMKLMIMVNFLFLFCSSFDMFGSLLGIIIITKRRAELAELQIEFASVVGEAGEVFQELVRAATNVDMPM